MVMIITADEESRMMVITVPIRMAKKMFLVNFLTKVFAFSEKVPFQRVRKLKYGVNEKGKPAE
jgi:hypothetical protein